MHYADVLPSQKAVLAVVGQPLDGAPHDVRDFAVWVLLRAREVETRLRTNCEHGQPLVPNPKTA